MKAVVRYEPIEGPPPALWVLLQGTAAEVTSKEAVRLVEAIADAHRFAPPSEATTFFTGGWTEGRSRVRVVWMSECAQHRVSLCGVCWPEGLHHDVRVPGAWVYR